MEQNCFRYLARGCSRNTFVIKSLSDPLVKKSLQRQPAQTVRNGAFSHKINYIDIYSEILNLDGHPNRCIGSKVMAICWMGGFCLLVELHREGSASVACTACLFLSKQCINMCLLTMVALSYWQEAMVARWHLLDVERAVKPFFNVFLIAFTASLRSNDKIA